MFLLKSAFRVNEVVLWREEERRFEQIGILGEGLLASIPLTKKYSRKK